MNPNLEKNSEKTTEELKEELERAKLEAELKKIKENKIDSYENDSSRIKKARTIKTLSIVNLCIIPAILSFCITLIVQGILTLTHDGKKENLGLKITSGVFSLLGGFFIIGVIIGPILTLIYANKEINS